MKRKDFKKLSPQDQKAVQELIREQPTALLGKRREQKKGYSDLPLFLKDDQTSLF